MHFLGSESHTENKVNEYRIKNIENEVKNVITPQKISFLGIN